eukprot:XP_015580894.1 LOW QUALITY PROTEIN: dnaJ homolog subfamily B member 6-like [Ricinus communis]
MANGEEKSKSKDFYQVLGLNKECTASELRNAYKKLALRWHPDRCSASGNSKLEEAKQNFQAIQQAYSVLSDANKRFLYDVGAYDSDDDENGMGDFLNEMAVMMNQTKPNGNGEEESFEELQELFEEMFQDDIESFGASCQFTAATTTSSTSSYASYSGSSSSRGNGNFSEVNSGEAKVNDSSGFGSHFQKCLGVEHQQNFKKGKGARGETQGGVPGSNRRRQGRKQNIRSSGLDVSSLDRGISAS